MYRPQSVNRRQALKTLAGGGAGLATILGAGAVPDPLEAAQVATRKGL